MISVPLLVEILLNSHNVFIILISFKHSWMVYIMESKIRVIKYSQFWKRVAAATKGDSLPSPTIDQTIFRINIFTLKHCITTYNPKCVNINIICINTYLTRHNNKKLSKIIQQILVEEIEKCSFLSFKFVEHVNRTHNYYRSHK